MAVRPTRSELSRARGADYKTLNKITLESRSARSDGRVAMDDDEKGRSETRKGKTKSDQTKTRTRTNDDDGAEDEMHVLAAYDVDTSRKKGTARMFIQNHLISHFHTNGLFQLWPAVAACWLALLAGAKERALCFRSLALAGCNGSLPLTLDPRWMTISPDYHTCVSITVRISSAGR